MWGNVSRCGVVLSHTGQFGCSSIQSCNSAAHELQNHIGCPTLLYRIFAADAISIVCHSPRQINIWAGKSCVGATNQPWHPIESLVDRSEIFPEDSFDMSLLKIFHILGWHGHRQQYSMLYTPQNRLTNKFECLERLFTPERLTVWRETKLPITQKSVGCFFRHFPCVFLLLSICWRKRAEFALKSMQNPHGKHYCSCVNLTLIKKWGVGSQCKNANIV